MKQKLYSISIFFSLLFISAQFTQAQQLIAGTIAGSVENLLGVRYRNVRNVNANQVQANFTGIPDLGSNRNSPSNNTRSDQDLNYGTTGTYSFIITYIPFLNSFSCVTTINGVPFINILPNVSGRLTTDGKVATANSINYFGLTVRTQNSSSTILVNNLTIDGAPITGNYQRSNSNGESTWYIVSTTLNNGFIMTGNVTLSGAFANSAEGQRIQFFFGNTPSSGSPLPLTWGDFTAKRNNNVSTSLNWSTLQEINTSHFDIERSEDGVRFEKIGSIGANGNTGSTSYYSFEDRNAAGLLYYYRLAQYDLDGRKSFSSVQRVGNAAKQTLAAKNGNTLFVQSFEKGYKQVLLLNMNGAVIKKVGTANTQTEIDLSDLPSGIYILQILNTQTQTKETHRFVK